MIDDLIIDSFSDEMESLALDLEEVDQEETSQEEDSQEEASQEESSHEESSQEESSQEESSQEESSQESMVEISGEVQVANFDSWYTPLNSCSAVTISVLIILFFLALASIGGVLND